MKFLTFIYFLLFSSATYSKNTVNIVGFPDPIFNAHMVGLEGFISERLKIGFYYAQSKNTDRPTYNLPNDEVKNKAFMRNAYAIHYALNNFSVDGVYIGAVYGEEFSYFESDNGSKAKVQYQAYGIHIGYQYIWASGFNLLFSATLANYEQKNSKIKYSDSESNEVKEFLKDNTESNFHPGFGLLLGWAF